MHHQGDEKGVVPKTGDGADAMPVAHLKNYRILLCGGGGYIMALMLGNPNFVLPWLSSHLGGPAFLVALIVPLMQIGQVVSELGIGPKLQRLTQYKQVLVIAVLGLAVSMLLAALATTGPSPTFAVWAILLCALVNGLFRGLYTVSSQELIAKMIHANIRGKLLAQRTTLGGLLTIVITLFYQALAPQTPHHAVLVLWIAVIAWTATALILETVTEHASSPGISKSIFTALGQGVDAFRQHRWFRDFIQSRLLMTTVELAIPFYAIHATVVHDNSAQNLSVFICALSLGRVLSGPVWGPWLKTSCHLVAASGAVLAACAGLLTLVVDTLGYLRLPYIHAIVVLILALGRQGVVQARVYYLSVRAPTSERVLYISFSTGLMGLWGMLFAFPLGWVAHVSHASLPLMVLIGLNAITAIYVARSLRLTL